MSQSENTAASPASQHKPYVPPEANIPEFSFVPVLVGALLGILFGASSVYLVLKVGMTISASIPIAVILDNFVPPFLQDVQCTACDYFRKQYRSNYRLCR